jgi:hypothetical protein
MGSFGAHSIGFQLVKGNKIITLVQFQAPQKGRPSGWDHKDKARWRSSADGQEIHQESSIGIFLRFFWDFFGILLGFY